MRRLEQSIKERAKRKDSILTSDSYAEEDDADDSVYSDAVTSNRTTTANDQSVAKVSNATSASATQTIVTKNKRSLSLHTQHEIRKVFIDSFYEDEATSD